MRSLAALLLGLALAACPCAMPVAAAGSANGALCACCSRRAPARAPRKTAPSAPDCCLRAPLPHQPAVKNERVLVAALSRPTLFSSPLVELLSPRESLVPFGSPPLFSLACRAPPSAA